MSLPDEACEALFPEGVPVQIVDAGRPPGAPHAVVAAKAPFGEQVEQPSVEAEGSLYSEAKQIEKQARRACPPEEYQDLLRPAGPTGGD
ncbi:MAG: hypothetical protein KJZ87_13580 [Thermoguttaceae bacterium]|nr:hypothetical protein [Thermoguttaceae bacterium]